MRIKFREVERKIEKERVNKDRNEKYKEIKPETDITVEEARQFLDNLFASMGEANK